MAPHSTLSGPEAADRLAIRELFDAYAHCADTRDAERTKRRCSRLTPILRCTWTARAANQATCSKVEKALSPVFADLNRYEATMHFNGQSTVSVEQARATGDSYTIAHHVYTENGTRMMMVAWLRYLDSFTKVNQSWYIAERQIILGVERDPAARPAHGELMVTGRTAS